MRGRVVRILVVLSWRLLLRLIMLNGIVMIGTLSGVHCLHLYQRHLPGILWSWKVVIIKLGCVIVVQAKGSHGLRMGRFDRGPLLSIVEAEFVAVLGRAAPLIESDSG